MPRSTDSQVKAKVWLKPEQVEKLRTACYDVGADYLQQRNEAIVATLYDTGLRVGELVDLDVEYLREGNSKVYVPADVQKQYPTENSSPDPTTITLADDTKRLLTSYLNNRWKDPMALFPSRSSPRITTQGVRNVLKKIADAADIRPYRVDGSRGTPGDVTPHALRHSVAYRMLNVEDGHTFYDVRRRLRHRSIQTTERVYDHIDEV